MKRFVLLALASALSFSAAQAQTKIKTKAKDEDASVKSKSTAGPVVLDGPIKRVETLSGIDVYPNSSTNTILLSFTQQFTVPGTLVMTNYKNEPIYTTALDPQTNTGQPVDLGRIPAGTYLVEAKTGNYVYWKKVRIKYPAVSSSSTKNKRSRR
ncbi:T9SS type A sorting domain-containing protein [Hymenobacter sp. J193]|uniref:T9SS type A sorting domain-containing protein n=1 Tax=Hymenobacter sp. J193 TaxID=2898429 RepID=UPI002150C89E|nr:T9SS type A sorting domain-containing protein [Hymenobacter sp. J193]MCR5887374.1 T9SS type A sorting domain-containing protein [Hymenobacter sp. J193]